MKGARIYCDEYGRVNTDSSFKKLYESIILFNIDDVIRYKDIYEPITAEKNINTLFGFKSQNFRKSLSDYIVHESQNTPAEVKLIAMQLNYKETSTDLVEYCNMSDKIMSDKINNIIKHINNGHIVKINSKGGYNFLTHADLDKYILFDISDKELFNFINLKRFDKSEINIKSETVILENGLSENGLSENGLYSNFTDYLKKHVDYNESDIVYEFKSKITGYDDKSILFLFDTALKNGLKNICFETTGQDYHMLVKMYSLLKMLMNMNPDLTLNLYIYTYDYQTKKLFTGVEKECKNIKVNIL